MHYFANSREVFGTDVNHIMTMVKFSFHLQWLFINVSISKNKEERARLFLELFYYFQNPLEAFGINSNPFKDVLKTCFKISCVRITVLNFFHGEFGSRQSQVDPGKDN